MSNIAAMSAELALVDDAMRDWRANYPRDAVRFAPATDAIVRVLGTIRH